jgi:chromosome segregation ATPase
LKYAKHRIDKLEKLNTTLMERTKRMESDMMTQYQRQLLDAKNTIQHLELEKKMAVMQYEHSMKVIQQYQSSVEEMQLEIQLLTIAKQKAIDRADLHETSIKSYDDTMNQMKQLQQQMNALEEWAIASNEAKTLAQERVRTLEQQIQQYTIHNINRSDSLGTNSVDVNPMVPSSQDQNQEKNYHHYNGRIILSKHGSLVVGAGDIGYKLLELQENIVKTILLSERVILRWKFDLGK